VTGHGWAWPIDADGEAIGAPIELHDVNVRSVTTEGGMAFDVWVSTCHPDWQPGPYRRPVESDEQ
jgi:hypothetical protein